MGRNKSGTGTGMQNAPCRMRHASLIVHTKVLNVGLQAHALYSHRTKLVTCHEELDTTIHFRHKLHLDG